MVLAIAKAGAWTEVIAQVTARVKIGVGVPFLLVKAFASSFLPPKKRLPGKLYYIYGLAIWLAKRVVFEGNSPLILNKMANLFGLEVLE